MTARTNLDETKSNTMFLGLSAVLVILSLLGVFLFFRLNSSKNFAQTVANTATVTLIPTVANLPTEAPISTISGKPVKTTSTPKPTNTPKPTSTPRPTVTPRPTAAPTALPTPTPETQSFQSPVDHFSISYSSSRKLYQDTEKSGNRYTLYSPQGNIAIHVGADWSWIYPNRQFTAAQTVAGKNTFVYEISTQTIVDFENGDQKFTIQCVHNGLDDLKTECQNLLNSFALN